MTTHLAALSAEQRQLHAHLVDVLTVRHRGSLEEWRDRTSLQALEDLAAAITENRQLWNATRETA